MPPLENSELNTIWHSAQRFFSRIREQAGYVPPEAYNDPNSYKPEDYSDVGQAEVMARYFSGELRYSPATHFIRYSDHYWQESEPGAQAVAHELTRRQMKEANRDLMNALVKMKNNGAQTILGGTSKAKAEQLMSDEQLQAFQEFLQAKAYQAFVIKRRDSKYITSALKESHPMLEISPRDLDADCFALNTRRPPTTCAKAWPERGSTPRRISLQKSPLSHPARRGRKSGRTALTSFSSTIRSSSTMSR